MKEIWKDIKDYNHRYQISNFGRVKSLKSHVFPSFWAEEKIMKLRKNSNGYLDINFCKNGIKKRWKISRLVALYFILNIENKIQVNHIDGNKLNNYVNNLEWVSAKENTRHAIKNNLRANFKGEKNGFSKLTEKDIKNIRILLLKGWTQQKIANKFKVGQMNISRIKRKINWSHII